MASGVDPVPAGGCGLDGRAGPGVEGGVRGLLDGEAGEVGDGDLAGVKREAERDAGGEDHDDEHGEGAQGDAEVAEHVWFRIKGGR